MTTKISTKNKIISSSINLFDKSNFSDTALLEISESSGVSIGSIYHAFPKGKTDILSAIAQKYYEEYANGLNSILTSDLINTSLETMIDKILELLISLGQKYPCYYDPIFQSITKNLLESVSPLEQQLIDHTTLMIQIKIPNITKSQAELKVKICYKIWDCLLSEYEKTGDKAILQQLKSITLQYLQN
jgi:AcrR family transcriptional regulator